MRLEERGVGLLSLSFLLNGESCALPAGEWAAKWIAAALKTCLEVEQLCVALLLEKCASLCGARP